MKDLHGYKVIMKDDDGELMHNEFIIAKIDSNKTEREASDICKKLANLPFTNYPYSLGGKKIFKLPIPKYEIGQLVYMKRGEDFWLTRIKLIEFSKCTDGYFILYHTESGQSFAEDSDNILVPKQ